MSPTPPTRILIIDDDDYILEIFQDIFADPRFQVFCANNGTAALTEMQRQPYDLAFIDIFMPGMDGLEVLTALLRLNPKLQAIMISGQHNIAKLEQALTLGAQHYLFKPLDVHDVLSVTLKCLRNLGINHEVEPSE